MDRASEALKAERLNHARKLLQRFDHLPDAVAQMVKDCGLSPRQVYRYLQQARRLKQPVPIADAKIAFTVKLSQKLVRRSRLMCSRFPRSWYRHHQGPILVVRGAREFQYFAALPPETPRLRSPEPKRSAGSQAPHDVS